MPLVALVALAGVLGFRLGQPVDEAEIIDFFAQKYVTDYGGAPGDCVAAPAAAPDIHMTIVCVGASGLGAAYDLNERGRLLSETSLEEPQA